MNECLTLSIDPLFDLLYKQRENEIKSYFMTRHELALHLFDMDVAWTNLATESSLLDKSLTTTLS